VRAWVTLLNERAATWQRTWRKRFLLRVRLRNDKGREQGAGFGVCNGRFLVAGAPRNDKMGKSSATCGRE
jgi:hypothetical protein